MPDRSYLPEANTYARILEQVTTMFQKDILLALYSSPGHAARNVIVADAVRATLLRVNANFGLLGRKILRDVQIDLPPDAIVSHAVCWFDKDSDNYWVSHLHEPVVQALEILNWTGEADARFASFWRGQFASMQSFWEGRESEELRVRRARNGQAREQCIAHYGCYCQLCKFDFGKTYGDVGKDFIEVHHLNEMSANVGEYKIDPIEDLRPVCSNCHRMLHRGGLKTLEELALHFGRQRR